VRSVRTFRLVPEEELEFRHLLSPLCAPKVSFVSAARSSQWITSKLDIHSTFHVLYFSTEFLGVKAQDYWDLGV
jgi:hypothetical protein